MNTAKSEFIQSITSNLIWISIFVFAYGFVYKNQTVMLIGMFVLGFALTVHAPISLMTINYWQKDVITTKLAYWGESFFAVGQFIFGVLAIIGGIADVTTSYLASGKFWQQVSGHPILLIFSFGSFCSLLGIAQIAANLKPKGEKLSDKLACFKDILHGIFFLLVGLFLIGLIIFVKLA